jgi:uncharacterized protein YbaP (TraB family)
VLETVGLLAAGKIFRRQRENIKLEVGFLGSEHLKLESKNLSKKVQPLETREEIDHLKKQHCDEDVDVKNAFLISIALLEIDPETSHPLKDLTRWFLDLQKSENAMSMDLPKSLGMSFSEKCDLSARNKLWYPTILKSLTESGQPVSVIAGVGHFLGKEGLFKMLEGSGLDLKIRQVTLADFK